MKRCTHNLLGVGRAAHRFSALTSPSAFYGRRGCASQASKVRNVAIVAHVDHGKTSLVDMLFKQTGLLADGDAADNVRLMDNNELEQERGITILSKCSSMEYKDHTINIVDTPGHQDFGGEVERVLSLVENVCLLVDVGEGPMVQTKFILGKALAKGFKPIVVLNKIDRAPERVEDAELEIMELFESMGATPEQREFPVIYASAKMGWADTTVDGPREDMAPLLDRILELIEPPKVKSAEEPFQMLACMVNSDNHWGRLLTGRVEAGTIRTNDRVTAINLAGEKVEEMQAKKLFVTRGGTKTAVDVARAGDIISIAGADKANVADTLCGPGTVEPIPADPIDPSTICIRVMDNTSPLRGREGDKIIIGDIEKRLVAEAKSNVCIEVEDTGNGAFSVGGRGELQLAILFENMRREGYELSLTSPSVVLRENDAGETEEPYEFVCIDVDNEHTASVIDKLSKRGGELGKYEEHAGKTRLEWTLPSRALLGYQSEFRTDTRGTGVMNRIFDSYRPYAGEFHSDARGALISTNPGESTSYALENFQSRGVMFIAAKTAVYEGMVFGESNTVQDVEGSPIKAKQLTNVRSNSKDDFIVLKEPKIMNLEESIAYLRKDELLEVTPKSLRLRKYILSCDLRRKKKKRGDDIGPP